MKKLFLKRTLAIAVIGATLTGALSGCGKSGDSDTADDGKSVQTIVIGSGNNYKPYCYLDEDGNATGYEYAVLKEIDALLPQYEFQYESMSFDNIVLSLDSKKVDVGAHQYEYTDERAAKYLFSKESYTSYITYIAVLSDVDDVNSLEDLAGQKIIAGGSTSATSQILTKYNEENPDKAVDIVNTNDGTDEENIAALKSGSVKAIVLTKRDVQKYNKNFGDGTDLLKSVGEPINNSQTYYLFRKDETELQEAIDGALKKLKENGKLSELSIEYIGEDVTESE